VIGNDGRRWSIGELARASGLTVRALRHYDEIGLLRAGERTAAGHRRYTAEDVRRLYRIRALRGLGLPLEEIARALGDAGVPRMRALLAAQLREVEAHVEQARRLGDRLRTLLGRLDADRMPDAAEFMTTLEMMSMYETHFTPEQREQLAERRAALGEAGIDAAKNDFREIVEEGLGYVRDGTPADDPRVRALVQRWDAVGTPFHRDEGTKTAARAAWAENSAEIAARLPWPADEFIELVSFLDRARAAR
jgi:DNA-binding transcriptional MerR regulator